MRERMTPDEFVARKSREINQAGGGAIMDELIGLGVDPKVLAQNDAAATDVLRATGRARPDRGEVFLTGGYETTQPGLGVDRGQPGAGPSRPGGREQPVPDGPDPGPGVVPET